jgi:multidrug efflux system membrane fusion protein
MSKKLVLLIAFALYSSLGQAQSVPVSVERLGDLRVERELRASASVLSANRALITSEETALIESIQVDVGATVKKGDILVRLDNDNATLALAQARAVLSALDAQIDQAEWRLAKSEDLLKKSFVSDDELVGRKTDVAVLQANRQGQLVAIQAAELSLARTRIRAPFDATVVQRQAQVGSFAQPGTRLMTVVQSDAREVDAELDPRYVLELPTVINIRYVSLGQEFPVELLRLSDVVETDTRKLRARFSFTDKQAPIGSSGEIAWTEITGVVPVTLIVQRGATFGVFTVQDNKAVYVEIPGAQEGRPASLDLPDDTVVVTRGHVRLQDGDDLLIGN